MEILLSRDRPNPEFPWDVHLRMISDWAGFYDPERPPDTNNSIPGLKQAYMCTGALYSRTVIITTAKCIKQGVETANAGRR